MLTANAICMCSSGGGRGLYKQWVATAARTPTRRYDTGDDEDTVEQEVELVAPVL